MDSLVIQKWIYFVKNKNSSQKQKTVSKTLILHFHFNTSPLVLVEVKRLNFSRVSLTLVLTTTFRAPLKSSTKMLRTFSSTTIFLSLSPPTLFLSITRRGRAGFWREKIFAVNFMMESVARNGVVAVSSLCHLKPQAISSFKEGISTILSQWRALQLAVENKWGGNDSLKKSKRLGSDIFSWFSSQSTALCEDLENLLHESLLFTFNTEIEDGSIEEVAEQLMVLHEEYLQGNH